MLIGGEDFSENGLIKHQNQSFPGWGGLHGQL